MATEVTLATEQKELERLKAGHSGAAPERRAPPAATCRPVAQGGANAPLAP
ncbi:hypothetical protein MTR72_24575 [Bradyrhizobium sp. ISRA442]|uniref:hypothetical protein n=1 Tax=Bradyrhizobium sp. ISRA442 TaxID=2866197 RepID=UPI00311AF9D1